MFLGASFVTFEHAKLLRNNPTKCESLLWNYLKEKPLGFKFRRQHPLSSYIADFYCHALKLIIEVDGEIHNLRNIKQYDKERQDYLEAEGISFLRFTKNEIEYNFESVINSIVNYLKINATGVINQ